MMSNASIVLSVWYRNSMMSYAQKAYIFSLYYTDIFIIYLLGTALYPVINTVMRLTEAVLP